MTVGADSNGVVHLADPTLPPGSSRAACTPTVVIDRTNPTPGPLTCPACQTIRDPHTTNAPPSGACSATCDRWPHRRWPSGQEDCLHCGAIITMHSPPGADTLNRDPLGRSVWPPFGAALHQPWTEPDPEPAAPTAANPGRWRFPYRRRIPALATPRSLP